MPTQATVDFAKQLCRMPVIQTDTGERLGHVTDAIVDPVTGRLLGITLRTREGNEPAIATSDFIIANDAIMSAEGALCEKEELHAEHRRDPCTCSELLGASVVTDQGRWVGRVVEIHISIERPRTVYRLVESGFQALWGRGFFMPGNAPRAYSRGGSRLIVPDATGARCTAATPAEVINQHEVN
jgi:sporulation protein YlmC with PRC-barrel domain